MLNLAMQPSTLAQLITTVQSPVFASNGSFISIYAGTFFNSATEGNGGVMALLQSSNMNVGSSSFTSNRAGSNGGVILLHDSSIRVFMSTFNLSKFSGNLYMEEFCMQQMV